MYIECARELFSLEPNKVVHKMVRVWGGVFVIGNLTCRVPAGCGRVWLLSFVSTELSLAYETLKL